MRVLLDTCTFLWIVTGDARLSPAARKIFESPDNDVHLSAVSTWEIAVKHALGRLPLPEAPEAWVPRVREAHAIDPLPLGELSTLHLWRLPHLHRDPFDRLLVCQAIVDGMVLLTPDPAITQYPARTMW